MQLYYQKNDQDVDYQNMIIEERDQEMRQILQQQNDINQIFKDLATLVEDQGEMVDDIRSNITSSKVDVKKGGKHLEEAEESQKTGIQIALGVLAAVVTGVTASIVAVLVI